jgi:glycosyltransferase involved in cell wall biosynthesis
METKKKIVLAAGVYPPQIGGPAKYAKNMHDELVRKGYEVKVVTYVFEHKLPPVIRHVWYFAKLLFMLPGSDAVIAFDTLSTGVPASLAAKILRKKCLVRIGGDFLWETHVEKTGNPIPLPKLYEQKNIWPFRNKVVYFLTNILFKIADGLVFNSVWQKELFLKNYKLKAKKSFVVKNVFAPGQEGTPPQKKNFLWAGRPIVLKNMENFKKAFNEAQKEDNSISLDIITDMPREELMESIKTCYAVVLPSYSDVAPNLVIEGIERGKPFVCTKYTSLITEFPDCGVFVDPENIEDMKKGVLHVSQDSVYQEKIMHIKKQVVAHSFTDITEEFLALIK